MSLFAGRYGDRWGRKAVMGIASRFLPLRILTYAFVARPIAIVCLQGFDGIGAVIYGVIVIALAADLTRGKGRFNAPEGIFCKSTASVTRIENRLRQLERDHFCVAGVQWRGGTGSHERSCTSRLVHFCLCISQLLERAHVLSSGHHFDSLAESKRTESAPNLIEQCGTLLKVNAGEVAERLKAAVC